MGCTFNSTASEGVKSTAKALVKNLSVADINKAIDAAIVKAKTTTGPGEPALWTLKDEDTTIYIFGSFHALPDDAKWQSPRINAAFAKAEKVYFEVDLSTPEKMATVQALIMERGVFTDGATLKDYLDDAQEKIVNEGAEKLGFTLDQLDALKPWLASMQLGQINLGRSSYSAANGVEAVLTAEAKKTGMEFGYFETADLQIKAISGDTLEVQSTALVYAAGSLDKGVELTEVMADEWRDGDVVGIGGLITDDGSFGASEAYNNLIVKRNRNWVPQIEAMLDTPGTVFIAVGAGHLAGPDSVINMMKANGHKITGPH
jgi:uncharacterized protein YbaP (TraB family)